MKAIRYITQLGKDKLKNPEMETALAFSNWMTVMVISASLGCVLLSYELTDTLVKVSWFFTILNASALLLNGIGHFNIARYVLSVSPSIYLSILHLSIKPAEERVITAILLIQIAMLTVPWMMFEYERRGGLISVIGANIGLIVLSVYLPGQNHNQFDHSVYATGLGVDFGLVGAAVYVTAILWLSKYLHYMSEKKGKGLIEEMKGKNIELESGKAELQKYIEQVNEAQHIEKKRQWVGQQIKAIFDITRSNNSQSVIFDQLIGTIVKALEANQGGLYTEETEHETYLELKSFYAYNRKKYIEQRIEIGQGLLGQCYLEKEITYLTEIPQNYTYITSGLGYATPTNLILVPLLFEDHVEGVLEVASFNPIDEFHMEYLEELSKTLGNFLYNQRLLKTHSSQLETIL